MNMSMANIDATPSKTSAELRIELAKAEEREKIEVNSKLMAQFKDLLQDKYFWYSNKFDGTGLHRTTVTTCGIIHYRGMRPTTYKKEAPGVDVDTERAFACVVGEVNLELLRFSYIPKLCYLSDTQYNAPHPSELHYILHHTREATRKDFLMLCNRINTIATQELNLFSGKTSIGPEADESGRLISLGQL